MFITNRILALSALVLRVGIFFNDAGNSIRNVWLIGDHLSMPLRNIGGEAFNAVVSINNLALDWQNFYNSIPKSVTLPAVLQTLIYWADDIISLITQFDSWVLDVFRRRWYTIYSLAVNPAQTIVNLLLNSTGIPLSFIFNPASFISSIVESSLGNIRAILSNPLSFVRNAIVTIFPFSVNLLSNPDGWLQDRIGVLFPVLRSFLIDPDGFIIERIRARVNSQLANVSTIAQDVTTKIVNFLW